MPARRSRRCVLAFAVWAMPSLVVAAITTDGTLGPARSFTGTNVLLPASLGRQKGGNVFQSLRQFDIPDGGRATFTATGATAPVRNVLARVTGGQVSQINGQLGCDIPGANLYLINPAGITFGHGSSLNVSGTFTATTADVVRLADGKAFAVDTAGDGVLTGAAPAGFGFLSSQPGVIALQDASLTTPSARLIGGSVKATTATLASPAGHLSVAAIDAGEISIDASTGDLRPATAATGGPVTLVASVLRTDGDHGGRVDLNGSALTLDSGSGISSSTSGAGRGRGVDVRVSGAITFNSGTISADTTAAGDSGPIDIHAATLRLGGAADASALIFSQTAGDGRGGALTINAGRVDVSAGGQIAARTTGAGASGPLTIDAHAVSVRSGGVVSSDSFAAGSAGPMVVRAAHVDIDGQGSTGFTGITSDSNPDDAGNSAPAGDVLVRATQLDVRNGGKIAADTSGNGRAAAIVLRAGTVSFNAGTQTANDTGVSSSSYGPGPGADVRVVADRLTIDGAGNASVSSGIIANADAGSTGANGVGGDIDLAAGHLALLRGGRIVSGGGPGRAGAIHVQANVLTLTADTVTGGTLIESDSYDAGAAGPVLVRAGQLTIDGRGRAGVFTGIGSTSDILATGATGPGGDVTVTADTLSLRRGGDISSATFGPGAAGAVTVHATDLAIDGGDITTVLTGINSQAFPKSSGASGRVTVTANALAVRNGGAIDSSTFSSGNGGDVTVSAGALKIDGGTGAGVTGVVTDANPGSAGSAGDLAVSADTLTLIDGGEISSGTFGAGGGGSVDVTAARLLIDAGTVVDSFTGINSLANPAATGPAGSVAVSAGVMRLLNGGAISTSTFGPGPAGPVQIAARRLSISGDPTTGRVSQIISDAAPGSTGASGDVTVAADGLTLSDAGLITSSTDGFGPAGTATVTARTLTLDGGNDRNLPTTISSQANTGSTGPAGNVAVNADALRLIDGGSISTSTFGPGQAGTLNVTAHDLSIDGGNARGIFTGIASRAETKATGTAGDVGVAADRLSLINGAQVTSQNRGTGAGGTVQIDGDRLFLGQRAQVTASSQQSAAGDVVIRMTDTLRSNGGQARNTISAQSLAGNGGNIDLHAGRLISLTDTDVTAQAATNGLHLTLDPQIVVLNHTTINGLAGNARDGFTPVKLTINPMALLIKSPDSEILNDNPVLPPDVDLTGAILHFTVPTFGGQTVLAEGCEAQLRKRQLSSFVARERLGTPPAPGAAVGSPAGK